MILSKLAMCAFFLLTASLFQIETAMADSSCQDKSVCGFKDMPNLNQGSHEMQSAMVSSTGSTFPGLCGPTTFTMVQKGYANEYGISQSIYGDVRTISDIDLTVMNFHNTSRKVKVYGIEINTDGTSGESAFDLQRRFSASTVQRVPITEAKGTELYGNWWPMVKAGGLEESRTVSDTELAPETEGWEHAISLVDEFRKFKTAGYTLLCVKMKDYIVISFPETCHFLAINGVDGNLLRLNDPWGVIYTVTQNGDRLENPSDWGGFIGTRAGGSVFMYETHRFYKTQYGLDMMAQMRQPAASPPTPASEIRGNIDGFYGSGDNMYLSGWACSSGMSNLNATII